MKFKDTWGDELEVYRDGDRVTIEAPCCCNDFTFSQALKLSDELRRLASMVQAEA